MIEFQCWNVLRLSLLVSSMMQIDRSMFWYFSIMVWGRFAAHGVGELVLIDGIMDQYQYIEIVETAVARSSELLFQSNNWTFQQDNDPKHTAINTQRTMHRLGIPLEDWPLQSSYLNPMYSNYYIMP